jgi:2-polyprenyl-3-methyl-5-hydroxy-6-metoxy-1,4-benzoquinol methylase
MEPNPLIKTFAPLLMEGNLDGPILDLACGQGQNGLFLADQGLPVILADRSSEALNEARRSAEGKNLKMTIWEIDLETGPNPLIDEYYRAILVFRYLHRPLIPCLKKAVQKGGILIYETFTEEQARYGPPHNPDHLLRPRELLDWFKDWQVFHYFEGLLENPTRAMAQMVCQKPKQVNLIPDNLFK